MTVSEAASTLGEYFIIFSWNYGTDDICLLSNCRVEEIEEWMAGTDYLKAVDNLMKTKDDIVQSL